MTRKNGWEDAAILDVAARAKSCIAKINHSNGMGTGFLLRDNWLLTCNHVVSRERQLSNVTVHFNHETELDGSFKRFKEYKISPGEIKESPFENGLDLTLLKLEEDANSILGHVELTAVSVAIGDTVSIISHPNGAPKKVSDGGQVVELLENSIKYLTKTANGSSGAPVFDRQWRVVAIHRGQSYFHGSRATEITPCSEGVSISAVLAWLKDIGIWSLNKKEAFDLDNVLAELLLDCQTIRDAQSRNQFINSLPSEIRNYVAYSPRPKAHVVELINRCKVIVGGFDKMVNALEKHEGKTTHMNQVKAIVLSLTKDM